MKRHLLAATALASFAVATTSNVIAQTALPGYAASVSGSASTTTSVAFNIIQFGSGWNANYGLHINGVQCGRTDAGTSSIKVTFNDTSSFVLVIPGSAGGGQASAVFESPLQVPADTNLTGTISANTTTVYCSAQGFVAS